MFLSIIIVWMAFQLGFRITATGWYHWEPTSPIVLAMQNLPDLRKSLGLFCTLRGSPSILPHVACVHSESLRAACSIPNARHVQTVGLLVSHQAVAKLLSIFWKASWRWLTGTMCVEQNLVTEKMREGTNKTIL